MNGGCGWIIHFRFYFVFLVNELPALTFGSLCQDKEHKVN